MTINILDRIKEQESKIQDTVKNKLANGELLTDDEIKSYKLTQDDMKVMEVFNKMADGQNVGGFTLQDFLSTPQAKILIPRVVVGAMRKAAEPNYLASSFFKKIKLKNGQAIMFPSIGVMRAHDIAEGQEINFGVSVA